MDSGNFEKYMEIKITFPLTIFFYSISQEFFIEDDATIKLKSCKGI